MILTKEDFSSGPPSALTLPLHFSSSLFSLPPSLLLTPITPTPLPFSPSRVESMSWSEQFQGHPPVVEGWSGPPVLLLSLIFLSEDFLWIFPVFRQSSSNSYLCSSHLSNFTLNWSTFYWSLPVQVILLFLITLFLLSLDHWTQTVDRPSNENITSKPSSKNGR